MENRFGVKDFFLFVLLVVLIVSVWLAMKQSDRQWEVLQDIRQQGAEQTATLAQIQRTLKQGISVGQPSTTQAVTGASDPFARIRAAQTKPDYAPGDWYIDSGPNSDKLTPLVSGDTFGSEVQSRIFE